MDRRYGTTGLSTSHSRTSNSFIPTTPNTKLPQHQIQQIALQSQLQAQSHLHMRVSTGTATEHHNNAQNYYQNSASNNRHIGSLPARNNVPINPNSHMQHQQITHSKNLNKQSSNHYGNTISTSSTTNHSTANGHIYYGTIGQNQNVSSAIPNWRYNNHVQSQKEFPIPALQIQPVIKQIQQQHSSNRISQHYQPAETEGLPQTLVDSMRTLFDILDDTKVGKIRLSDIETRWENNDGNGYKGNTGAEPLIKMGVMGYLRKVTPPDGMLTFDRFCAGLRLALLTNNNPLSQNQFLLAPNQLQFVSQQPPTNPHFSLQQHVRNMTSNLQGANNFAHPQTNAKSNNAINQNNHPSVPNNSSQRTSKIPSMSSGSRLPMPNVSGLPVSPNRLGGNTGNLHNNISNNTPTNGINRQTTNAEQGTTIAVVHQAPPHQKSSENLIYSKNEHISGTLKVNKSSPTTTNIGKENRHSGKNGSLDNLISDNDGKDIQEIKNNTDRPPSAPLLDAPDAFEGENEQKYYKNNRNSYSKGERNRSREREIEDRSVNRRKSPADEMSFGKRVVSFVTPRQRTLSMPQLQLNKLKPKSTNLEDESSISPDSSLSPGSPRDGTKQPVQGTLKTNFISKIVPPSQISIVPGSVQKLNSDNRSDNNGGYLGEKGTYEKEQPPPPPKPPRNSGITVSMAIPTNSVPQGSPTSGSSTASGTLTPSKPEIRGVLQSWQKEKVDKNVDEIPDLKTTGVNQSGANRNEATGKGDKKTNLRRRETPRRHTVQSGVDFATLKRLKQLEQERDVLQQGSTYIENTREWYFKQLEMVDDKIGLLTKGAPTSDYWSECHEERLNLLGCRISEVNNLLTALMDGSSRLPLHMNLQIPSHLSLKTITRLKEQNRQLTQEVSDCSQRVTQLETEKAMLLRQLFHQKNNMQSDETVYM